MRTGRPEILPTMHASRWRSGSGTHVIRVNMSWLAALQRFVTAPWALADAEKQIATLTS
jgi:hypothetical protein